MLKRFRSSLQDSPIERGEIGRIQGVFVAVCLVGTAGLIVRGFLAAQPHTAVAAALFGVAVLISWALERLGYLLAPRLLVLLTATVLVTALAWRGNGIHDIAISFYPMVVIFSGLLLGTAATGIFALICSAAATLLVWADLRGITSSPASASSDFGDSLAVAIMLGMSAALVGLVLQSLRRSLRTLRASEAALEASNQRLEARAQELRASEARWRSLIENAPDGIMNVSQDGRIVFAKPSATQAPGTSVPTSVYDLVAERERPALHSALQGVFTRAAPVACELRAADGQSWWSVRIGPIGVEGAVDGATLILSDITERRSAENERRSLERQVQEGQRMEALGQLAGGIAHDFNNLLTVISGNASLLESDLPAGSARECVGEIQSAQERAANLVRQLLAFGRRQVLRPQVIDLRRTIESLEGMFRKLLGENVKFEFLAEENVATVLADPGQIEQVVVNLVLNARDAMSGRGRLQVKLWSHCSDSARQVGGRAIPPGRYTVLSVSDNGPGMDESLRSRIFQPFFTTKPRDKGTGLGLSSSYGIVAQSGGQIAVESAPGRGTTFHIYLPESDEATTEPNAEPEIRTGPSGSGRILVVEDNPSIRRLLQRVLRENGFEVLGATSGAEALELGASGGPIDLVLADLILPGMDGRELARRFQESFGSVAVILMSGYADQQVSPSRELGSGERFLQKPFSNEGLLSLVRETLDTRTREG